MSKKYTLNSKDLQKILTGAVVAMLGALLTYVAQTIGQIDFGPYTPVVVAFSAVLINIFRKFITGN